MIGSNCFLQARNPREDSLQTNSSYFCAFRARQPHTLKRASGLDGAQGFDGADEDAALVEDAAGKSRIVHLRVSLTQLGSED
jgi:hypothetical protein